MNDELLEAVVEDRLEQMGVVPYPELVAIILDMAWDIAAGEYDEDEAPEDDDGPATESGFGFMTEEG